MILKLWILSILLASVAYSTDVKGCPETQDFEKVINQIQAKIAFIIEQVKPLNQRDIESDIEEIKKRLDSYGEDITALRITQSEHSEILSQHSDHFATVDETLVTNAGQLSAHDQTFVEHLMYIEENGANIASHSQMLIDHLALIQANTDGINNNGAKIQENQNGIAKNGLDIQTLLEAYNAYRYSQVKFLVQTRCCEGSSMWPDNTRLVYNYEHRDTHNALDTDNGQFTAPMTGLYEFVLSADYRIYDERSDSAFININHNDQRSRQYMFDSRNDDEVWQAYSIFFIHYLNQGDRLDISVEGDPIFDITRNPILWTGYLIV